MNVSTARLGMNPADESPMVRTMNTMRLTRRHAHTAWANTPPPQTVKPKA